MIANRPVVRESYPLRAHFDGIPAELSADAPTPLAFSRAPLFRPAAYALTAEIRTNRRLGDFVLYRIMKRDSAGDYAALVYESASYEDIADVWEIFR